MKIHAYHLHIYFEKGEESHLQAKALVKQLQDLFSGQINYVGETRAIGPHTKPNYAVHIVPDAYATVAEWLLKNDSLKLSILIHPETGDDIVDHLHGASLWIGEPVPYNDAYFEKLRKRNDTHS